MVAGHHWLRSRSGPIGDHEAVEQPRPEGKATAQREETDGTPTASDPVEGDKTDPDKDGSATPTDDAGDPQNADLNAGALSQPTSNGTP